MKPFLSRIAQRESKKMINSKIRKIMKSDLEIKPQIEEGPIVT